MNILSTPPGTDPLDNADALTVARRLAFWMGPAIRTADGSPGAALYLALGAALGATRAFTERSLAEVFAHLSDSEIDHWERSLGMVPGDGSALVDRQAAVRARWLALNAGSTLAELRRTVIAITPDAVLVPIAAADVVSTDPDAVFRVAILLPDEQENDPVLKGRIDGALAAQAEAHVDWAIGRGAGPGIDEFYCDRADSECDRDLLAS